MIKVNSEVVMEKLGLLNNAVAKVYHGLHKMCIVNEVIVTTKEQDDSMVSKIDISDITKSYNELVESVTSTKDIKAELALLEVPTEEPLEEPK